MFLLFKNGIKHLFKEKVQLTIYVVLILISVLITSLLGTVSLSLRDFDKKTSNQIQGYNYSYKYTSSNYSSNDTATLSPWFAFDNETLTSDKPLNGGLKDYSTLTFGKDKDKNTGALLPLDENVLVDNNDNNYKNSFYNSSSSKAPFNVWVNFHFGDLESDQGKNEDINFPTNQYVSKMSDEDKFNKYTSKGEFGDFYRFNFNSDAFNSSLIGQLYKKFKLNTLNFNELSELEKEVSKNIFDYMYALNNSNITDIIKFYLSYFHHSNSIDKVLELFTNVPEGYNPQTPLSSFNDVLTKGLNGRIGWFMKPATSNTTDKLDDKDNKYEYRIFDDVYKMPFKSNGVSNVNNYYNYHDSNKNIVFNGFVENENELVQYGSVFMKNFVAEDLFATTAVEGDIYRLDGDEFTNKNLFNPYNNLVGYNTNFKSTAISQVVSWNSEGDKFKFIDSYYTNTINGKKSYQFNNPELMNAYNLNSKAEESLLSEKTFLSSPGYAINNNLKIGQSYSFINNSSDDNTGEDYSLWRLDGYGVDSMNTYPTVFDEDLISDSKTQGIFYIHNKAFQQLFGITSSQNNSVFSTNGAMNSDNYQDLSRMFLKYNSKTGNNMGRDINYYKMYLANNLTKLGDIKNYQTKVANREVVNLDEDNLTALNIQDRSSTMTINLKSGMLKKVSNLFTIISIVFILIFLVSIIFVVFNIVKRFFENQKNQLGNLKSMGYRKRSLVLTFVSFMTAPVIPIVFIGWGLSFALQKFFVEVLSTYFSMDNSLSVNWKLLLVLLFVFVFLIGGIVWLYCFVRIKEKPLTLLAKTENAKVSKIFTVLKIGKLKNRFSFLNKLRLILISSSMKDIGVYLLVFFVSSFVLTMASILPSAVKNMSDNYYTNIDYSNAYQYNQTYSDLPLSAYNIYPVVNPLNKDASDDELDALNNSQLKSSAFNVYFNDSSNYSSLISNDSVKSLNEDANWSQRFETVLLSNILTLHNINISVSAMNAVKDKVGDVALNDFNILAEKVLPKLFGQKEINEADLDSPVLKPYYSQAIQKIMSNQVPSTIKKMWESNEENFNNFSIEFANIPYDSRVDELGTSVSTKLDAFKNIDNARILGLDPNAKNKNVNINVNNIKNNSDSEKVIPVSVSKKMKLLGLKEGDEYSFKTPSNKLYLGDIDNSDSNTVIDKNWWKYDNSKGEIKDLDKTIIPLDKLDYQDLAHTSFFDGDDNDSNTPYYQSSDGSYRRYIKMQNIMLDIPKESLANKPNLLTSLSKVTDDYNASSGNKISHPVEGQDFTVRPYDTRKYIKEGDEYKPQNITLDSISLDMSNWLGMAIKDNKLFKNTKYEDNGYKIKVNGYENIYYGSDIYMDQAALNKVLGFSNPDKTIKVGEDNVNMWSNIKFSKDENNNDQFRRVLFNSDLSNTSFNTLSKTVSSSIGKVDYISITKQTISEVITYTTSIAIIFIFVTMVTGIIVIYLITDLFVGKYKAFMSFMKVQGYTNREINSVILWVFLPITIFSIVLGIVAVITLVFGAVPQILLKLNIAVPLSFNYVIILMVIVGCLLIFSLAYTFIIRSMLRIKLSTLSGQM